MQHCFCSLVTISLFIEQGQLLSIIFILRQLFFYFTLCQPSPPLTFHTVPTTIPSPFNARQDDDDHRSEEIDEWKTTFEEADERIIG